MARRMRTTLDRVTATRVPVIGAINGDAFGGGAELALLQLIRTETTVRWHVVFLDDGPMIEQARKDDPRVTRIGSWLRERTSARLS